MCVCVGVKGVSVPGASTARPSACADQPSRRSTACRGTRRGRPRRRWRARRPPRAARRCLLYGLQERRPPGSYHPAAAVQSRRLATRGARVTQSPRVASPTGTRRTWPARPRKRALTFEASGELPALAVRRMLRQHDCADSVASDGGGGGAGEAEQDEQAGMACAAAAASARERRLAAQVCRGGESADYSDGRRD